MRIFFASPNYIEPWDYRNVFDVGIGGSETSHVEMATRLAKRGYEVISYTQLPDDCPDKNFMNVQWKDLSEMDLSQDGLWIIYRRPGLGSECFPSANRRYWLVCQDVWYNDWDSKKVKSFDRIIGLCPRHMQYLKENDPENQDKYCMSSNGINIERIIETEKLQLTRKTNRLIWASSPDRGLAELLKIFERTREQVDIELHIFYGMDNINKLCGGDRQKWPWKPIWDVYDKANRIEGVTWRGRIGQRDLAKEWIQAGIWLYPTWFSETSCISCMEAQAYGAIPITNPIWATLYNVRNGIFIEGEPNEPLITARYVDSVVKVASNQEAQEMLRMKMMPEARRDFDWEVWVDQWINWMEDKNVRT